MFIERLKQAKDALREAKEITCECAGECVCERSKAITKAQDEIDRLVESVHDKH
jgi:hypothetical protein